MGLWGEFKKRLPDAQPVKNAGWTAYSAVAGMITGVSPPIAGILRSSYDRGRSAIFTVDRAVRVDGFNRVRESMPEKEVLKRIGWTVTDNAVDTYTRALTGGLPVYRTLVNELTKTGAKATQNVNPVELKELHDRIERLEAKLWANSSEPPAYPHRSMTWAQQKPEDVISIFMMKGFTAASFVEDQVVLQHHEKWRRDSLLCPVISSDPVGSILPCDEEVI